MNEKAIIVGVNTDNPSFNLEMKELESLCNACNIDVVDTVTQNLTQVNPKTYVGLGKLEEIKVLFLLTMQI